jgi:hypothetical protein
MQKKSGINHLANAGSVNGFAGVEFPAGRTLEKSRRSPGTLKAADGM